MPDPVDELIREIAAKHGIAVARDDPILVLQTINSRLLQDSSKAQQLQLDAYKSELEALAHRWGNDARDKAERILNAALAASQDAMGTVPRLVAETTAASVRQEVEAALTYVVGRIRDTQRSAVMNVVASVITFLAAVIVIWGKS